MTFRRRCLVEILGLALVVACGPGVGEPRAQWLVTVHTDAPVPQLGDRLLVELLLGDGSLACSGCQRLFGLRRAEDWPVSFGIPAEPGSAERKLRVRLFRADHSDSGGLPTAGPTLDQVGTLPTPRANEVRAVDVVLSTSCAFIASDPKTGRTCDPNGPNPTKRTLEIVAAPPRPGSFAPALTVPCSRAPEPGMICVPGGLFVRGSALILETGVPSVPERLVQVRPFAFDTYEMTVAAWRGLPRVAGDPVSRASDPACTFTTTPGDLEQHPINCVTRTQASSACRALGKRLPTEAEWEYAAGNRDLETRFPWGDDADICAHAVVGRGRLPIVEGNAVDLSSACRTLSGGGAGRDPTTGRVLGWGTVSVSETNDTTDLGVHGLGGNVSEWVADELSAYAEGPCAQPVMGLLVDPVCTRPTKALSLFRGGSWDAFPLSAESARRDSTSDEQNAFIGFRCATSL